MRCRVTSVFNLNVPARFIDAPAPSARMLLIPLSRDCSCAAMAFSVDVTCAVSVEGTNGYASIVVDLSLSSRWGVKRMRPPPSRRDWPGLTTCWVMVGRVSMSSDERKEDVTADERLSGPRPRPGVSTNSPLMLFGVPKGRRMGDAVVPGREDMEVKRTR